VISIIALLGCIQTVSLYGVKFIYLSPVLVLFYLRNLNKEFFFIVGAWLVWGVIVADNKIEAVQVAIYMTLLALGANVLHHTLSETVLKWMVLMNVLSIIGFLSIFLTDFSDLIQIYDPRVARTTRDNSIYMFGFLDFPTLRLNWFNVDPNVGAYNLLILQVTVTSRLKNINLSLLRASWISLIIVVMLSQSRGALLALSLYGFWLLYSEYLRNKPHMVLAVLILFIGLLVGLLLLRGGLEFERIDKWAHYIDKLNKFDYWIGKGLMFDIRIWGGLSSHNSFIMMIFYVGVLPTVLLLFIPIVNLINGNKLAIRHFITAIIGLMTLDLLFSLGFWLTLLALYENNNFFSRASRI